MKICREEKKGKHPLQKRLLVPASQTEFLAAQALCSAVSEEATLTKYLLIPCTAELVPCAIPAMSMGQCRCQGFISSTSCQNQAAGINIYNTGGIDNRKKDLREDSCHFFLNHMPGFYLRKAGVQKENILGHECIKIHKTGSISALFYVSMVDVSYFCRQRVINSASLFLLSDLKSVLFIYSPSSVCLKDNK